MQAEMKLAKTDTCERFGQARNLTAVGMIAALGQHVRITHASKTLARRFAAGRPLHRLSR